ncbi:MAG: hypothetical protein ACOCOQ_03980 [Prevotella sp.]
MKKQYIQPLTGLIPAFELPTLLAVSPQTDHADSKESEFGFDTEDSNPWNSGNHPDYDPWK